MVVQYPKSWPLLREMILKRDNYKCRIPGCRSRANQVDHIKEKSKGGTDDPKNLRAICTNCHANRHPHLKRRLESGKYNRNPRKLPKRRYS